MRGPLPETRFEHTAEWLHVHARGTFDLTWLSAFFLEIIDVAKTADPAPRAILVDARELTGPRPTGMEVYDLGVLVSRDIIGVPVAFVASEAVLDPRRFGEAVARNRGLNVRAFSDMDEALTWLRA